MLRKMFDCAHGLYVGSLILRGQFSLFARGVNVRDGMQDMQSFVSCVTRFTDQVTSERNAAALRFTIEAFFDGGMKAEKSTPKDWKAFMGGIEKALPVEIKAAEDSGDECAQATMGRIANLARPLVRSYRAYDPDVQKSIDLLGRPSFINALVGEMMSPYGLFEVNGKMFWALNEEGEAALEGTLELAEADNVTPNVPKVG